jgi:aldehyde:ferredoxin oxidoreductase
VLAKPARLLNDDLPSIIKFSADLQRREGWTRSHSGRDAELLIECYENGLLTKEQLDGLEMKWGNAHAIIEMTKKIARRDGVGDILADGAKVAWEKFGKVGTEYAIHVGGEELPAHDPACAGPALARLRRRLAAPRARSLMPPDKQGV